MAMLIMRKLFKIILILFLFFIIYWIQAISSHSKILTDSQDIYHNISNPIENNYVVCDQLGENDDHRFIECQKILNLEIPDNDSLSCFGSQLKLISICFWPEVVATYVQIIHLICIQQREPRVS
jgi:hypothetical protein